LQCYDCVGYAREAKVPTPNIDRIAEGCAFTRCQTVNPICQPARTALLTGRKIREAIRDRAPDQPFFVFGSFCSPHKPFDPPPRSPSDAETPVRIRRGTAGDLALVDVAVFA